jgi:hypothetical protein
MNDFSAPKLRDTDPPPVFTTVTSRKVQYNDDFIEYLMKNEQVRLQKLGLAMTPEQTLQFRQTLVTLVNVHNNPEAAIAFRTELLSSATKQLNG